MSKSLYVLLKENTCTINERLFHPNFFGSDHSFLEKKKKVISGSGPCNHEKLWTFLVACGYAMGGLDDVTRLSKILTGVDLPHTNNSRIWLEASPLPPRKPERNTSLDLAIGSISQREPTKSGIGLSECSTSWICFCEMKWNSDISESVEHDPRRNQLIRVIENALCFQGKGKYAERTQVTLVTPAVFKDGFSESRIYQSKFREYQSSASDILKDLDSSHMEKRSSKDWRYPSDIDERVEMLELRWVTFYELFDGIPDSPIREPLKTFWIKRKGYA